MDLKSEKTQRSINKMDNGEINPNLSFENYPQLTQTILLLAQELSGLKKMVDKIGKNRFQKTMDSWVNGDEVLKALKISKRTLQSYRDKGLLNYSQFGNKLFYKVDDVKALLEKNYKGNQP
jgi:hypothetical protein